MLWGGVGGGGCVVVAEFGVKCLHFLHADVVGCTQLEFVHGGRWVEIDVVGEGVGGGIVFTFFLCRLESRRLHSFRGFFGFSLQVGISLDPSPEAGVFLSQRLHFFSTAFLQICEFLLHLCLAI